jgi:hypothetical protein
MNANGTMRLEQIDEFLRSTFTTPVHWHVELAQTKQQVGESVKGFVARLKLTVFKGRQNQTRTIEQEASDFKTYFFMNTLPDLQARLRFSMPATSGTAIDIAVQWEQELKQSPKTAPKSKAEHLNGIDEPYKNDIDNRFKQLNVRVNNISKKKNEAGDEDAVNAASDGNRRYDHKERHVSFDLPPPKVEPAAATAPIPAAKKQFKFQGTCYFCKKPGHRYTECHKASVSDIQKLNLRYGSLNQRATSSPTPAM